jgi:hypothetical protein
MRRTVVDGYAANDQIAYALLVERSQLPAVVSERRASPWSR